MTSLNKFPVWHIDDIRIFGRAWYFFIDYLEKDKTINRDYYMELMDRLSAEIKKKQIEMQKKKVLFHEDNASCYKYMNNG